MTNPCASRSVAVQDVHVKVTNWERCIVYKGSSRLQRFHAGPARRSFLQTVLRSVYPPERLLKQARARSV